MREMIDTRGRLIGPERLQSPLPVPSIRIKTIQNKVISLPELKSTLLCISSSALGFDSLSAVIQAAKDHNLLNIHMLNGYLRYGLLYYPLKRHLLKDSRNNAIMKGPNDAFRDLGVLNTYGGYAFWISKKGDITWRSSGGLTVQEVQDFSSQILLLQ